MNKNFTLKKLSPNSKRDRKKSNQKQIISKLIQNDKTLYEEFLQILGTKQIIEKSFIGPSEEVINRIISYSKSLATVNVAEPELRIMIQN